MDLALRTLREGPTEAGPAPLLLLCDDLTSVGGPALLRHVSWRSRWHALQNWTHHNHR